MPLIIEEPSTPICQRLWNDTSRVASVRLLYAEASAALARAHRVARLTTTQLDEAIVALDAIVAEVDHVEVTDQLVRTAGTLARMHGLRGYDAVHLSAGTFILDSDVAFVTGDSSLAAAALAQGFAVSLTNP
jgi:predicted nucleic acid-binding protein